MRRSAATKSRSSRSNRRRRAWVAAVVVAVPQLWHLVALGTPLSAAATAFVVPSLRSLPSSAVRDLHDHDGTSARWCKRRASRRRRRGDGGAEQLTPVHPSFVCWMATSSSDLKRKKPSSAPSGGGSSNNNGTQTSQLPKNSVVRRLKRAATLAVEEANLRKKKLQQQQPGDEPSQNQRQSAAASSSSSSTSSTTSSSRHASTSTSSLPSTYKPSDTSQQPQQSTTPKGSIPHNPLPTLRQLTQVIDRRLQHPFGLSLGGPKVSAASASSSSAFVPATASSSSPAVSSANTPPDSMGALYMHNHLHPRNQLDPTTRHVAVVLAKPLQDDRLTVEGAARVKYLLHSILEGKYAPHLVVFCGPVSGPNNRVSDADASYMYFRNLWECTVRAHRRHFSSDGDDADASDDGSGIGAGAAIALRRPEFYLERVPIDQGGLQQLAQHIQQSYVGRWWEEIVADEARQQQATSKQQDESGTPRSASAALTAATATAPTTKRVKPKKLQIHFSLVSSEYQLCQLNDIHVRSPNQSALRALRSLAVRTTTTAPTTASSSASSSTRSRSSLLASAPQVEQPTWSFHGVTSWLYSSSMPAPLSDGVGRPANATTTPAANQQHHHHPLRAFCAKTYKTAQHMVPVLYNLRGVVEHREFFQRDNYRALVAARRSLITDMERMYHLQPGLRAVHTIPSSSSGGGTSASASGSGSGTAQHLSSGAKKTPSSNPTATYFANMGGVNGQASSTSSSGSADTVRGAGSRSSSSNNNNNDETGSVQENKPLDVVLESALLSIGRCLDLVRPAGLLTGSVTMDDFRRALSSLQQAYYLLDRACDPDEPLPAEEWTRPLPLEPLLSSSATAALPSTSATTSASRRAASSSSWWGAPSTTEVETPNSSSNSQ